MINRQKERGKEILTFLYKDMEGESAFLAHAMEQSGAFPASSAAMSAPAKRQAVWMRL